MRWRWPGRRARDTTDEALEQLHRLEECAAEVNRLGAELRQVQRKNNFSRMVDVAFARRSREEGIP